MDVNVTVQLTNDSDDVQSFWFEIEDTLLANEPPENKCKIITELIHEKLLNEFGDYQRCAWG